MNCTHNLKVKVFERARVGPSGGWKENVRVDQTTFWLDNSGNVDEDAIVPVDYDSYEDNILGMLGEANIDGCPLQIVLYEAVLREGPHRIGSYRSTEGSPIWSNNDLIGVLLHEVMHLLHKLPSCHHLRYCK